MRKIFIGAAALAMLAAFFASPAVAQWYPGGYYVGTPRADITYLTFSGSVRVPGATLPAGTYEFRRMSQNVLQVVSKDRSTVYAMFQTISRWRTEAAHSDEIVFGEMPSGEPPLVAIWFPAHRSVGYEFLYSTATAAGQFALK